jgi:hypothetical protein
MGVSLRQGTYFLRAAHPGDGIRHKLGCPFHQDGTSTSDGSDARPVVGHNGDKTILNLDLPAYLMDDSTSNRETTPHLGSNGASKPRKVGKLRTLLDWLWSESEINYWSPNFAGRRNYHWLKFRLDKSLSTMSINGRSSQPILVVPPYDPNKRDEFLAPIKAFEDELKPSGGKYPVGIIMGVLKEVKPVGNGFVVLLKHNAREFHWLRADQWERINNSWFGRQNQTPDQGYDPGEKEFFIAMTITRKEKRGQPGVYWSKVEDFASLPLADTRTWIPVDSGHERKLALAMVEQGRSFIKPIAIGAAPDTLPDFILEDTAEKHVIEVLGLMNDPEYVKRVNEKRAIYVKQKQPVIWWIPGAAHDLPDLPSVTSR